MEKKPEHSKPKNSPEHSTKAKTKISAFDFIVTFLSPLLIGKSLSVYFGAEYAANPGEGYGYALLASMSFTLFMIGRFLWKYRHYNDGEE